MSDRKVLKDCIHYMILPSLVMFFATLMLCAFPTVSAYLIGDMADSLLSFDKEAILAKLPYLFISIGFTVVVAPLIGLLCNFLLVKKGYQYDAYIFGNYLKKNLREIEQRGKGEVVQTISDVSGAWCYTVCELLAYPLALVAYVTFLFVLVSRSDSSLFFMVVVVVLPTLYVIRSLVMGSLMGKCERIRHEYSASRRDIEEKVVPSADWLRSWKLEGFYKNLIDENLRAWSNTKLERCNKLESLYSSIKTFLDIFIPIAVLFAGVVFVFKGQLTPGELLAGYLMLESVKDCYAEVSHWVYAVKSYKEYQEKMSIFYGEFDDEKDSHMNECTKIFFEDVSFSYEDNSVLEDVSLNFVKGKKYRLLGENGAGKSTLIRLLAGLYCPKSGAIFTEGNTLSLMALRHNVTLAEQTSTVFTGSVFDNLFVSDTKRAEEILSKLGFEKTLDYEVGRDGEGLSPGEKKKLILARAFLCDRSFLILDEPFNHLDNDACSAVVSLINKTDKGVIVISHKEANISYDDEIVLKKHTV